MQYEKVAQQYYFGSDSEAKVKATVYLMGSDGIKPGRWFVSAETFDGLHVLETTTATRADGYKAVANAIVSRG